MKRFFLVFGVIMLCLNASCSAMQDSSLSSSKKRKLRRKRAQDELQQKKHLEKVIIKRLYGIKNNETTYVCPKKSPKKIWFSCDPVVNDVVQDETKKYPEFTYTFFGDYIEWRYFLEDL